MKSCLILLCSILILSCGESHEETHDDDFIDIGYSESLNTKTENLTLSEDTPSGVGTLLAIHDGEYFSRKVSMCTWSLIDSNIALTNSHCIPEAIKKNKNLDCSDYLQGAIQLTDGSILKTKCKKVYFSSDIGKSTVANDDYALIEIDQKVATYNHLKLSRAGIKENENLTINAMNHNNSYSGIVSKYERKRCYAKSSDLFGAINTAGSSPLTLFGDCKTIGGNSGSPVLNWKGDVVGVVHGGVRDGGSLSSLSGKNSISKVSDDISIITNLKCMKFGIQKMDKNIAKNCSSENKSDGIIKIQEKLEKLIVQKVEALELKLPKYIEFELKTKSLGKNSTLTFSEKCIKSIERWSSLDVASIKRKMIYKRSISYEIPHVIFKPVITFNRYGNFGIELEETSVQSYTNTLNNLQKLKKDKEAERELNMDILGKKIEMRRMIPLCPAE